MALSAAPSSHSARYLEYFAEYPLGQARSPRAKRVALECDKATIAAELTTPSAPCNFCWKVARQLENTESVSLSEGVWPINHWRAQRAVGSPGTAAFALDRPLRDATPEVYAKASERRSLAYFRIRTATDAIRVIREGLAIQLSTNISTDWYDPPDGRIPLDAGATPLGAHNVALIDFNPKEQRFVFPNSWGSEWGHKGWGAVPLDALAYHANEMWVVSPHYPRFPPTSRKDILCREWKWAATPDDGIHCRELVDGSTDQRLAWAFCVRRNGFLEIDDLYVWPTERGKGYGRVLADMVSRLSCEMRLPLRMLVSYADAPPPMLDPVNAIAARLGLKVAETDAWDVPLIGEKAPPASKPRRPRPERPAFLLEWLRPKDEATTTCPAYDVVFGTDRELNDATNVAAGFNNERAQRLLIGTATIDVGPIPTFGCIGRAWQAALGRPSRRAPPFRVIRDDAILSSRMQEPVLQDDSCGFNFLFVHGFRVSFHDAVAHGARLGAALKVPGSTFVYSWPATSYYPADSQAVEASLPHFSEFVSRILQHTSPRPLAIVAHSMGNRLLLRFLVQQVLSASTTLSTIAHTVFAAPDVDHDVFQDCMQTLKHAPFRKTLYTARGDAALALSELIHDNPRAGLTPPVLVAENLDTILVEGGPLLSIGHAYYGDQSDILHDMFQLFHYSAKPATRRCPRQVTTIDGHSYWKIEL